MAIYERRLSDDVRASAHRIDRTGRGKVEVPALVHRNLDNVAALFVHPRKGIELVQRALVCE